jgi:hypothetical protein
MKALMPRNERTVPRSAEPSTLSALVGVWKLIVYGLAAFALAGGLVLAGIGAPAGPLLGVMAWYLIVFLGAGMAVAGIIEWIYARRRGSSSGR